VLCSKNNPRNIYYMPVVIFFACPSRAKALWTGGLILNKNPHSWKDTS